MVRAAFERLNVPPQGAAPAAETLASGDPLITGSTPVIAAGVATVCLVMIAVFFLMMRGRVRRATRRRELAGAEFFQPAGEDADISFDDDTAADRAQPYGVSPVPLAKPERGSLDDSQYVEVEVEEIAEPPKKKRGPFAGLFGRKQKTEAETDIEGDPGAAEFETEHEPIFDEPSGDEAVVEIMRDDRGARDAQIEFEDARRRAEQEAAEIRARAEREAADARRRAEEDALRLRRQAEEEHQRRLEDDARRAEERREAERRRYEEEEAAHERKRLAALETSLKEREAALARASSEQRAAPRAAFAGFDQDRIYSVERRPEDISDTLAAVEEALVAQSEALKAETRNQLADFSRSLDQRFERLVESLDDRRIVGGYQPAGGGDSGDGAALPALDAMSRRIAEHKESVNAALADLARSIDEVLAAPTDINELRKEITALRASLGERALGPSAPKVQLGDLIANALPPNVYDLNATLANGRRADCLVRLPFPPGPIAIDASFPVEAFDMLARAGESADAENSFRRIALRHVVDIAERLIAPDETAESALMFLPSEAMFATLHARFPDLVQDSYRARVWIVSPTSLMATLNTIRAVLRDARTRESAGLIHAEAREVLTEVDALRQRVQRLELSFDEARNDVRDLATTTAQVYARAETITNTGRAFAEDGYDRGAKRIIAAPPEEREPTGDLYADEAAFDEQPQPSPRPPFPLR